MRAYAVNFDGLVGPTHNFAGLGKGNLASMESRGEVAKPRQAALQGLYKMKMLSDLGLKQGILPPHERPDVYTLRQVGFTGTDAQVIEEAFKQAPTLATACYSASSAWAANSATITPSIDSLDGHVHITPANLASRFHRSLETNVTSFSLMGLFAHEEAFTHHEPLPSHPQLGDEGSANQIRLCADYGQLGIHLFTYGCVGFGEGVKPSRFPARQSLEACQALARLHQLKSERVVYAQQNPELIDAGVFHNDIAAVGNKDVLLYHEKAWIDTPKVIAELEAKMGDLTAVKIALPVEELVKSYVLNSQLLSLPSNEMVLIAPVESRGVADEIVASTESISRVLYFDLFESMRNGGGPACLSLQAVLTDSELEATNQRLLFGSGLYHELVDWVNRHYRDELSIDDLCDPDLLLETREALDELTELLDLGPLYPFQQ